MVCLAVGLASAPAAAEEGKLVGAAKVRAPEMLVIDGTRVRLSGVLPPDEAASCRDGAGAAGSCVAAAASALATIIGDGDVTCIEERRLGHGYYLGHCRTADGTDPAEALLSRGLLRPESGGILQRYATAVASAKSARAGLWGE